MEQTYKFYNFNCIKYRDISYRDIFQVIGDSSFCLLIYTPSPCIYAHTYALTGYCIHYTQAEEYS